MPNTRLSYQHKKATPRDTAMERGVASLSDFELFELVVGGRTEATRTTAHQLQYLMQQGVQHVTYEKIMQLPHMTQELAKSIMASLELAKRHYLRDVQPLKSQHDILIRLLDLRQQTQEHFVCLSLDGGRRLIAQRTITVGTLDTALAHPREVFADPIADRAASVVVAHNHPSGDPQPSPGDITLTQQLVASGQLLGIPLHDHIIVAESGSYSFRQHHLL